MLVEKLTDDEKALIDYFRHNYNEYEDSNEFFVGNYVNIEDFLCYWEDAKAPLIDAFGGNLIIKKPIQSIIQDDDLRDRIESVFWMWEWTEFRKVVNRLVKSLNEEMYNNRTIKESENTYHRLTLEEVLRYYIFNPDALMANRYDGPTIEISLGNGKVLKLVHGCKLMKICGRFAKELSPPYTEYFETVRLRHSQVMNEANIKANLCLSIHPLDFMTASYNDNDWRSCMNWDDGEFRRGVIEMMNSTMVVCAYLESNSTKMSWCVNGAPVKWNSKRWREFFIVRPDMISGIKGYPYWNRELEDETLNWLRQIFGPFFGSNYADNIKIWRTDERIEDEKNDISLRVQMECGPAMYNDFYGGMDYHSIFVKDLKLNSTLHIDYSGASECVVCGGIGDFDTEGTLCCKECVQPRFCASCGEVLDGWRHTIEHNGRYYCEYCYEHLPTCDYCGEIIDENYEPCMTFVVGRDEETKTDVLRSAPSDSPFRRGQTLLKFRVCEDCYDEVFKDGVKETYKELKWLESWFDNFRIVPLSHLTDTARRILIKEEDLKYFMEHPEEEAASA